MAHILIVDDQQHIRFLVKRVLEAHQYTVAEASDGFEALEVLDNTQSSPCDLILLDLLMPKMDGYEFLARLKARQSQPPVVIVTAVWKPLQDSSNYPISGLLPKPFTRQKLLEVVQQQLPAQTG